MNWVFRSWGMVAVCVVCWVVADCRSAEARPVAEGCDHVLSLAGTEWRIHDDPEGRGVDLGFPVAATDGAGWIPATVPGNIQGDLEDARLVHPIQYAVPDPRLYDMTCRDWWYRRDFDLPASFTGRRLTLVFDGVDHVCEVFLNGVRIGGNTGMFTPFQIDVTDAVTPGNNRLALRIEGLPEALRGDMEAATGMMGRMPFAHAVRRQYHALKSTINCGYDWSMPLHTLGIWKDVRLEATGPARIDSIWTRTALFDDYSRADVKVRLEMNSTEAIEAEAALVITGPNDATVKATVPAALNRGDQTLEAVIPLEHPALWWPNGQGGQPLYRLDVTLTADGQTLDRRSVRFGVREIRWALTEGAPADFPIPWRLVVNGRPVRMMGSNLVPPDLLFGVTRDNGVHVIEMAHAAGMNTLRVWGGGIILPPVMYDRADELGIMFSQEFPIANSEVERDQAFLANLEVMAAAVVRELRNHPSLVEWSGGNEIPGHIWYAASPPHPALMILREAVAAHDDRRMIDTCPVAGGHDHWPYVIHLESAPPGAWGYGAMNYFEGWNARNQMRFGEFATQSPAHHEVWQRVVPPPHRWPLDDPDDPILFRKHVFHTAGSPHSWLHKADILDPTFGPTADMDAFVRSGQWLGAEGTAYAIDEIRRRGGRVGGFMTWLFNEPWPNGAGHFMIDHDGRPLMKYAFVQQALAPIALSLRHSGLLYDPVAGLNAQLWIVSDHPGPRTGLRWSWTAWDRRGTLFAQGTNVASSATCGPRNSSGGRTESILQQVAGIHAGFHPQILLKSRF